ncbi:crossover junction endonuclease EME1 isoform X2 [Nymphalis io]|uniref:crossover junction endonuclease EME1 isoform X2 n=1 Tax=Inachis io TaxID=171585 RepID=UPI0021670458|nr:crossover junction endonuclease EME1 isoform X2 [Nymphalis io]
MNVDTVDLSCEDSNENDQVYWLPTVPSSIIDLEEEVEPYFSTSGISNDSDKITQIPEVEQTVSSSGVSSASKRKRGRKNDLAECEGKKTTAKERQTLKKKLAEERKAAKNANKIFKPGECIKYMTVEIHPVLLESWFCADIQREVSACGARLKTSSTLCDTALVLWTRTIPPTLTSNDGVVQLTPSKQRCAHGLYIQTAVDIESLVISHTLADNVRRVKELAGCELTLVLFGVKEYFKMSGRKTANSRQKLITEIDLEKAITDLLVSANCDTIIVNTPNEVALTIVQFTKAIAEEPYKKSKRALDEQADFYMRGDNKKCVAVDKDGNGLSRLWQQMIAILPLSSLETSRALCAHYKTPLALYESLHTSAGVTDLANVGVSRAAVPGSKARRIGPEFARKLHTLFTAEDGNILLE